MDNEQARPPETSRGTGTESTPYGHAAHLYRGGGWSPIPLPARRKSPPPTGWTGYDAPVVSGADIQAWIDAGLSGSNVGLRLPDTVLGLDVDAYDGKPGENTMRTAIDRLGTLPTAPRSTSRGADDLSGIRFYRVPPGRRWADALGPGVEVIHPGHRYAVTWPSVHPEGGIYRWYAGVAPLLKPPSVDELPELSDPWVIELDRGDVADRAAKADLKPAEVLAFLAAAPDGEPCRYLTRLLEETVEGFRAGGSRHGVARDQVAKIIRAADQGHHGATTALDTVESLFRAAVDADSHRPSDPGEWARMVSGAVALVKADPTDDLDKGCCPPTAWPVAAAPVTPAHRDALIAHLRTWQGGEDFAHVDFAVAVAVSAADETGDPLWGMIVGPPSSGKTETVRALDDVADDRLDEVTTAALLSWTRGSKPKPTGVLARVPDPALLTIADFSTVLATSDKGSRDQLFSDLRRVYDGALRRDLGNAPGPLRWDGRLTILAAVTPVIDDYSSHADALGPRWLYLRMPEVDRGQRRRAAGQRRVELVAKREQARALAVTTVKHARAALSEVELNDDTLTVLGDAAVVVAAGRGAVPRDGYGRRDVIAMPTVEEPHRLVGQLQALARGLLALGHSTNYATELAVRAALDTIPRARLAVLRVLTSGTTYTVSEVASVARLNRKVARFALEDLREVGIARCPVEDDAEVDDVKDLGTTRRDWQLTTYLGGLAVDVLTRQLGTKRGEHPPIPPGTGEGTPANTQVRPPLLGDDPLFVPSPHPVDEQEGHP